ncbi:hypothetical protein W02_12570 [Nitrospira sp. KM1]|uniref:hypothetical protein n=1 Tax=Nitrospira sp. KM1 TaxID=1936990 RepID=UPI0013A77187|nr:hypothetical protein [Nitrospira sp. KM1]BCA54117.1 hypothetical protein W02_12570 [Nitrospira sp. KM1]
MLVELIGLNACGHLQREKDAGPSLQIGPAEVVLTAEKRPYSWPDGTMGIVKDGAKYKFYAASAGYPVSAIGTLDNPISDGVRKLEIQELKKPYDYVAGGPIYRDEKTGCLLMFYHAEFYIVPPNYLPFYSEIGIARSLDEGQTWIDLGAIVTPHLPRTAHFYQIRRSSWDIGWGAYAVVGEYFYLYFADLLDESGVNRPVNHGVARARIVDVLQAATEHRTVSDWKKYFEGHWSEPGIGGKSSTLIEQRGESFLLGDISYNEYIRKYIAVFIGEPWPNSDLYWAESEDALQWTHFHKIVDDPGHEMYVTLAGTENQPRRSGREVYLYYVHSNEFGKTGDRNRDGRVIRRRLTFQ